MRTLNEYISEKLVINKKTKTMKENPKLNEIYSDFIITQDEPSIAAAKIISQLYIYKYRHKDVREKVKLTIDNKSKTMHFEDCEYIKGTLDKHYRFCKNTNYKIILPNKIDLYIRSGGSMENRKYWPGINGGGNRTADWWEIVEIYYKINPNIKIENLILNRFDCEGTLNKEILKKVYIGNIHFTECKYEQEMVLPSDYECREWKNPNMTLSSESVKAEKYYKEEGF